MNQKDLYLARLKKLQASKKDDTEPMERGSGLLYRKRVINPIIASLKPYVPTDNERLTDAYSLLERFYKINRFTQIQNPKLFRLPHLQGDSFFTYPFYQSFYITVSKGTRLDSCPVHLYYHTSTGKNHWIASCKVQWEWSFLPKPRLDLTGKLMRLVNTKAFKVTLHNEQTTMEK